MSVFSRLKPLARSLLCRADFLPPEIPALQGLRDGGFENSCDDERQGNGRARRSSGWDTSTEFSGSRGLVDNNKNASTACADVMCICFVLAAILTFGFEQAYISGVNGWSWPELFSLVVTNPALSFSDAIAKIAADSNPPIYLTVLYGIRKLIPDDVGAMFALNMLGLLVSAIAVIMASWKAGMLRLGLLGIVMFLLSGPVLRYALEARAYLLALGLCFVATWFCALAVEAPQRRPGLASFAFIGVLGALLHVYAALLCAALAAGVVVLAFAGRRRDLAAPGLVLGASASLVVLLWLVALLEWAPEAMGNISWIQFTPQTILNTLWEVRTTALGEGLLTVPLVGLIVFGLIRPNTRSITLMITLANVIFIAVPLAVSIIKPIIVARYWLIGAPSLIVLMSFLVRTWSKEGFAIPRRCFSQLATGAAVTFLFASDVLGFGSARFFVASKMIWKGATFVASVVKHCPANSVHVDSHGFGAGVDAYAYIAHAPQAVFVDAAKASTPLVRVSDAMCPILGWAEAVNMQDRLHRTDEELLRLLKIDSSPAQVQIDRHSSGYIVAKPGTVVWTEASVIQN
jgi:hypothetical protein